MSRDVPSDAERVVEAIDDLRRAVLVLAGVQLYALKGGDFANLADAIYETLTECDNLRDADC